MKAAVVALDGPDLSPEEAALLREYPPAGVILFGRNIAGPLPLARLVGDLREVLPPESVIMVDQEGGRVARLRPPDWPEHPAAGRIGGLYAEAPNLATRLAWLTGALIGMDCADIGFDVVCAPVLDLRGPHTTDAIGDRSYGADPDQVAALAMALADGLISAGMQPVGKHAPGHGSARVDSHQALPRIEATTDLAPEIGVFAACRGLPWMMTAHVVYEAIDPERPGTLSPAVLQGVIRDRIGFAGVLVSDDLAMGALSGLPADLAGAAAAADLACAAIAAGCDLALYCAGHLRTTRAVLAAVPDVGSAAIARMARARGTASNGRILLDRVALARDRAALLAATAAPGHGPAIGLATDRDPTAADQEALS